MQPIRVASKPTITTRVYDSASRIISRPGKEEKQIEQCRWISFYLYNSHKSDHIYIRE